MLSTEDFKAFAKDYVMFAHVTTRIEGRKNDGLLMEKGGTGFPYLVALDENGDVVSKLTGGRSVEGFREMMAAGARFVEVRAKAEKTLDDEVFVLEHDIAMGNADLAQARERVAKLEGLSEAQSKQLDAALLGLEIEAALPRTRDPEEGKRLAKAAGELFAKMWAEGREPTSDQHVQPFFILMLDHAESQGDADLFERALGKLRERFGDNPRAARFFDAQQARLDALRAPADDGEDAGEEGMDEEPDEMDDGE